MCHLIQSGLELVLLKKVTSVRKVYLTIDFGLETVASIDLLKLLNALILGLEEIGERAHKREMLLENGQNRVNEGKNILFSAISEIPKHINSYNGIHGKLFSSMAMDFVRGFECGVNVSRQDEVPVSLSQPVSSPDEVPSSMKDGFSALPSKVPDVGNLGSEIPGLDLAVHNVGLAETPIISSLAPTDLKDANQEQGTSLGSSVMELVPSISTHWSEELSPKVAVTYKSQKQNHPYLLHQTPQETTTNQKFLWTSTPTPCESPNPD
ncbi:hypothetical protein LOK49_LG10G02165 [Camellia lanceoleosa]|uniref:Uncharacterized protein n=1 Tax=Camellia lanceoleosa TaxID=1840588 RepID=A0ACC0G7P7_9ERIC|nr:hypothetical protein LOK49_LG10G02165 [Camellia lanceoleosa]